MLNTYLIEFEQSDVNFVRIVRAMLCDQYLPLPPWKRRARR